MAKGGTRDNGEGSLVDVIHYESMGVMLTDSAAAALAEDPDATHGDIRVGEVKIPIEVRLRKAYGYDSSGTKRAVKELQFSLVCRKPAFTMRGTDIEALRLAMWAELDRDSAIDWKQHMLVTIERAHGYGDGVHEGLQLSERMVWKGTTRQGVHLLREMRAGRLDHGWSHSPWPGAFSDKKGVVTACIPATPENEAAMEEFRSRIRDLRARLQDLVRPDVIMRTLADLSGVALLAAPGPRE